MIPAYINDQLTSLFPLDDRMKQQLCSYVSLLEKWNKAYNLVGKTTVDDIWQRHILDSIQLAPLIPKGSKIITDFGSGAGLPAIILAICFPQKQVHVIESVGKKSLFMAQVSRETELSNVTIHNERIEQLTPWQSDVITARAFAPLPELFTYIMPFLQKDCLCLLPKGCKSSSEVEEVCQNWTFSLGEHPSLTQDRDGNHGVILAIKDVGRKNHG